MSIGGVQCSLTWSQLTFMSLFLDVHNWTLKTCIKLNNYTHSSYVASYWAILCPMWYPTCIMTRRTRVSTRSVLYKVKCLLVHTQS
uniref:Putative ovule protein n=1 Tax=Solanum chacoense TaxID=4108 RepID=A0A0V0GSI2_SOLCH